MKVTVNEDCIGCGLCAEMCPQVFEMGASGVSEVVGDANCCAECAESAAEACPVNAIEIA